MRPLKAGFVRYQSRRLLRSAKAPEVSEVGCMVGRANAVDVFLSRRMAEVRCEGLKVLDKLVSFVLLGSTFYAP